MTNPSDEWRLRQPAAPHARGHDRLVPGPQQNQAISWTDDAVDSPTPTVGTGSPAAINLWLFVAKAFVVFLFSPLIFGTLYPLATAVAFAAGFATNAVLRVAAPHLGADGRRVFWMLAIVIVFWPMSRFDHRLADTLPPYRFARHVARVVLVALALALYNLNPNPGFPRSLIQALGVMSDHRFLPVLGVLMVVAHLVLTKATGLRERWRGGLEIFRLRAMA